MGNHDYCDKDTDGTYPQCSAKDSCKECGGMTGSPYICCVTS